MKWTCPNCGAKNEEPDTNPYPYTLACPSCKWWFYRRQVKWESPNQGVL